VLVTENKGLLFNSLLALAWLSIRSKELKS